MRVKNAGAYSSSKAVNVPFTSEAKIFPEQAVGRGLRLMQDISPDRTQTLEVVGTEEFEKFVKQLETEGVGIRTVTTPPPPPVKIAPVEAKLAYDISIPLTQLAVSVQPAREIQLTETTTRR